MKQLIHDIRRSFGAGIYSTALVSTLSLPDACAKVDTPNVKGVRERYVAWYDNNVSHSLDLGRNLITGEVVYKLRCGLSHELRIGDKSCRFDNIYFSLPDDRTNRIGIAEFGYHGKSALVIDLGGFIGDVTVAVEKWLASAEVDPERADRLQHLMKFETEVLNSFFGSIPSLS